MEKDEPMGRKLEIEPNVEPENEAEGEEVDTDFEELDSNEHDDDLSIEEEDVEDDDVATDDEELDDLQKESDIPLDTLISLYGSGRDVNSDSNRDSILDSCFSEDETADKEPRNRNNAESDSSLDNIPLLRRIKPSNTLHLLSSLNVSRAHADPDTLDDVDDEDYVPTMPIANWKKNVQMGEAFQVDIPNMISPETDSRSHDSLAKQLWSPDKLTEDEVNNYLMDVRRTSLSQAGESTPHDPVLYRDNEQALFSLVQYDYHPDKALNKPEPTYTPSGGVRPWTEEECAAFEGGLRLHGKSFFHIQTNKLPSRSVGELVQFYYFWKKTERREVFFNRGKHEKRFPVTPGITDYTSRFHHIKSPDSAAHMCDCGNGSRNGEIRPFSTPDGGLTEVMYSTTNEVSENPSDPNHLQTLSGMETAESNTSEIPMPPAVGVGAKESQDCHNSGRSVKMEWSIDEKFASSSSDQTNDVVFTLTASKIDDQTQSAVA